MTQMKATSLVSVILRLGVLYIAFTSFSSWFLMASRAILTHDVLTADKAQFLVLVVVQLVLLGFVWCRSEKMAACILPKSELADAAATDTLGALPALQSALFYVIGLAIAMQGLLTLSELFLTSSLTIDTIATTHSAFYIFKAFAGICLMLGSRRLSMAWRGLNR